MTRRAIRPLMLALPFVLAATVGRSEETPPTIAKLLDEGWEVAGYTGAGTTFILFRHKDRPWLVQCSVLYDTTRGPTMAERVRANCYEVR